MRAAAGDVDVDRALLVVRGGKFGNYGEGAIMPSSPARALSGAVMGAESSA